MYNVFNLFELGTYLTLMVSLLPEPPPTTNGNNMSRADCLHPRSTGYCKRYSVRWYFDGKDGVCRPFAYGGCGGNRNNFHTQAACTSSCSHAGNFNSLAIRVYRALNSKMVDIPRIDTLFSFAFAFMDLGVWKTLGTKLISSMKKNLFLKAPLSLSVAG